MPGAPTPDMIGLTLLVVQCALCIVLCALCTVHCTMCSVQYKMYIGKCILFVSYLVKLSVQCAVYRVGKDG